ncbi:hypothetical protein [Rhodanobacter sp. DHB23]|uniref:hypothetical protein n=1 Tax=Rhodanobacter sp. DHB23 TaxID=2775923 RepID=UPI00177F9A76|nr:hypothetical protein [Rhodanobacter sp. DHB23]MBD8874165.1 hypothetical protein [Rhodanobacter sp. DHB23]
MHIEPMESRLASFRDFAKHYLMIVLSILTALGLEAWIEHMHHAHAAATASAQIETEIRQNLADIDTDIAHDNARMQFLEKLRDQLQADVASHAAPDTIQQHIHQLAPEGIDLDWRWPVLRREAWDVTVANQSAGWIAVDRLRSYSAVYAAQEASTRLIFMDVPSIFDGPQMQNVLLDVRTGDYQPRDLLHVVNQMCGVASEATHGLQALAQRIHAVVPDLAPDSGMPAAAH